MPPLQQLQGRSLVPVLMNAQQPWDHPLLTTHHPGKHAIRSERWPYTRYANGDEELNDDESDPHEWKNLASDATYAEVKRQHADKIPKQCVPYAPRLPRRTFTQEFDWSTPE